MRSVKDKVALVTGGGSGIGRATVSVFASEGARVVVSDVDPDSRAETARPITAEGGEAVGAPADIASVGGVGLLAQRVIEAFGRIDCAFNTPASAEARPVSMIGTRG